MVYVQRDAGGAVIGAYRQPQPGYAEEKLADDDPAVVAYLDPPPSAAALRRRALAAEAAADPFIDQLRGASAAQIQNWVQANVTDLAGARAAIAKLAVAVAYALGGGSDKP